MKTIEEWLKELPDEYAKSAIRQCEYNLKTECRSLKFAVGLFAVWEHTDEGYKFWEEIFDNAKDLED